MNGVRRFLARLMAVSDDSPAEGSKETFDRTLPSKHAYLGDLREVSNTPYYAEGSLVLLPVVYVPDVVLMPNQQIPINVEAHELDLNPILNDVLDGEHQRKCFVCMAADTGFDEQFMTMHPHYYFGTIASVERIEDAANPNGENEGIRMVVRGCQRCFLKQSVIQGDHFHQKHYGWFRILAEDCLPPPLSLIIPSEWRNIPARTPNFLQAAYLTRLPPPFYATTDPELLMKSITEEIKTWQLSGDFPSQATEFSYWVSSNLPMPVTVRLQLLGAASTTHRLRACLMMLRGFNRLLCTGCSRPVASKEDGLPMSKTGLTAAYINPGGLTQEIFTVQKVSGSVQVYGKKTLEYTWFPGYAWRHLYCRYCHRHLGWRYDSDSLNPRFFYGLKRDDVLPSFQSVEEVPVEELQEVLQEKIAQMNTVLYRE